MAGNRNDSVYTPSPDSGVFVGYTLQFLNETSRDDLVGIALREYPQLNKEVKELVDHNSAPNNVQQSQAPLQPRGLKRKQNSGPCPEGHLTKRIRINFTSEQIRYLENEFSVSPYITLERRVVLAQKLGVEEYRVRKWYQNRRMKCKKEAEGDSAANNIETIPTNNNKNDQLPNLLQEPTLQNQAPYQLTTNTYSLPNQPIYDAQYANSIHIRSQQLPQQSTMPYQPVQPQQSILAQPLPYVNTQQQLPQSSTLPRQPVQTQQLILAQPLYYVSVQQELSPQAIVAQQQPLQLAPSMLVQRQSTLRHDLQHQPQDLTEEDVLMELLAYLNRHPQDDQFIHRLETAAQSYGQQQQH